MVSQAQPGTVRHSQAQSGTQIKTPIDLAGANLDRCNVISDNPGFNGRQQSKNAEMGRRIQQARAGSDRRETISEDRMEYRRHSWVVIIFVLF